MNGTIRTLTDHPGFATATKSRNAMQHELRALEQKLYSRSQRDSIDVEAARLVAGEPARGEAAFSEELATIRHRIAVMEQAIKLQRQVEDRERYAAGCLIARAKLPEYKLIIGRMAAALSKLKEAAIQERRFREQLDASGVSFTAVIHPMPIQGTIHGDGELEALADAWLNEAKEFGLL